MYSDMYFGPNQTPAGGMFRMAGVGGIPAALLNVPLLHNITFPGRQLMATQECGMDIITQCSIQCVNRSFFFSFFFFSEESDYMM